MQERVQSFLMIPSCSQDLQAEETPQNFLQSKEDMTDAILQPDQTLIEKQEEFEGEAQVKGLHSLESC